MSRRAYEFYLGEAEAAEKAVKEMMENEKRTKMKHKTFYGLSSGEFMMSRSVRF
jgi:hypothetical protein